MEEPLELPAIAYLTQVKANHFEARLLAQENKTHTVQVDGEEILVGQLGSYVFIQQNSVRVLAMVNQSRETESGVLLHLIPLGELNQAGEFQRGVRHYPTPGADVYAASKAYIQNIFAKFKAFDFSLGQISNSGQQRAHLNPSTLCGRNFTILGQSGSGKSWTVASVLQQAVHAMPKAHIILLDLHGEYCWKNSDGQRQASFKEGTYRYFDARALEIPYWLMTYGELIDLLIDRSDTSASVQTAFLREALYSLKKKEAEKLDIGFVSIDAPIYFSLEELYKEFKNANELRTDFGKTKGPLFGQFDEFLVKLQSRMSDVRYDFLLKPKRRNTSESLPKLLRDFVGLGDPKCQVTIIDLSGVPFDVRPAVSSQIGRLAFEFNYWNPRNREFPLLLVCEEAHAYIPREGNTQYEGTRRSMERIAKEGRKYGVGLGVVSQRPHELSETVLSQCSTYICLRLTNPDDQAYVRDLVPDAESDLVDILPALGRGEAMVMGEAVPLPTRVRIDQPDPAPNSQDVDYHDAWRTGPEDLNVEAIADRWRRQGRF
ncbi:MAG: ATPase [Methylothermaceae bacteria B42]|nr:MAG: ATPase [Methylothermaceae bacteria B42]HHJ40371.1 ATP-binding protein [Methylothermaceae bacterium]